MLTQPNDCPPPIPAPCIPLSKNKINDRAWGWALAAAAGGKVTPTVRLTKKARATGWLSTHFHILTSGSLQDPTQGQAHKDP